MENISIFDFILNDDFMAFIVLLGKFMQDIFDKRWFWDFENIVDIWLLKCFMKLLRSILCVSNTLTYELLMWFFPCAMT